MKISGGSPLKGMGGKERRGAHLDILSRGLRVPSYATGTLVPIYNITHHTATTTALPQRPDGLKE